ncbi:MAG: hypothetical protein ILP14_09180 [Oscillospiraceae bacterium]|nr:hypothetical protein [Oscillospiraceae bacterium]
MLGDNNMAAYMGRDIRHLLPENLVVPVHHVIEPVFPMHGHQRHPVIIQEKESTVTRRKGLTEANHSFDKF